MGTTNITVARFYGVPLSPLKRRVHRHSRKMDTKMDTKTPDSDVKSGVLCSIITHNVFPK